MELESDEGEEDSDEFFTDSDDSEEEMLKQTTKPKKNKLTDKQMKANEQLEKKKDFFSGL